MLIDQPTVGVSLSDLFKDCRFHYARDIRVTAVCTDAEQCKPGDLFVARVTESLDTHELAELAVQNGARAILTERLLPVEVPQCLVANSSRSYASLCHSLAGEPSKQLSVVGIAGNHGKATAQVLLSSVLSKAGRSPAIFGETRITNFSPAAMRRESSPSRFASWLAQVAAGGYSHAVTELGRSATIRHDFGGTEFSSLVLTGLSSATRRNAITPKTRKYLDNLLAQLKPHGLVVANIDCPVVREVVSDISNPVLTVSTEFEADVTANRLEQCSSEQICMVEAGEQTAVLRSRVIGDTHLQSCLLAIAAGLGKGVDLQSAMSAVESVQSIAGQFERIECGQPFSIFVDGALSSQRLREALLTLREQTSGRVICVFGQGESPRNELRQLRGRLVERYADLGIVTSDNVVDHEPLYAAHDVLDGYKKPARAHVIPNRTQAIRWALDSAEPGDTVLLAGPHNRFISRSDDDFPADGDVARFCLLTQDQNLRDCLAEASTGVDPNSSQSWN